VQARCGGSLAGGGHARAALWRSWQRL
jgi:hypothetical protein